MKRSDLLDDTPNRDNSDTGGDPFRTPARLSVALILLHLTACGGTTVVDPGGGGSGGTTSGAGGSTPSSSSGNTPSCTTHADCPEDTVCLFGMGQCVPACDGFCDTCGPTTVCSDCATSSCPACADCLAACVPTPTGMCDEDDPCPDGAICLYEQQLCAPACSLDGACADPSQQCDGCASGSCCGCKDCVPACTPP